VRVLGHSRRNSVQLVTEARRGRSEDIAYRERRYLIMMGFRVVCFIITIVLFAAGAGWVAAIPAVGALVIPYFAVVFANGGREPSSTRGFRAYEPNLPERYSGPGQNSSGDGPGPGQSDAGGAGPRQQ
jgi:Protein of unknown function (DUF3099)